MNFCPQAAMSTRSSRPCRVSEVDDSPGPSDDADAHLSAGPQVRRRRHRKRRGAEQIIVPVSSRPLKTTLDPLSHPHAAAACGLITLARSQLGYIVGVHHRRLRGSPCARCEVLEGGYGADTRADRSSVCEHRSRCDWPRPNSAVAAAHPSPRSPQAAGHLPANGA